jgi:hypothetical protein
MALHLVLHQPAPSACREDAEDIRVALLDAVWEVAESHWAAGSESLLVSSDLSSDYLLAHFRGSLTRRGIPQPAFLLVAPLASRPAMIGVPSDAEGWMEEAF